jgi:hypothetical protein
VSARAFVSYAYLAVLGACGGHSESAGPSSVPSPTASVSVAPDRVTIPGSVVVTSTCVRSVSATRSWSTSTVLSATDTVALSTLGEMVFAVTCRDAAGKTATASATATGQLPLLSGRIFGLVAGEFGTSRVYVGSGSVVDSANVLADGRFSVPIRTWSDSMLPVLVDEINQSSRKFFPWLGSVRHQELGNELRITRVPREWQIRAGAYKNSVVPISLELASPPPPQFGGTYLAFYQRNVARLAPLIWEYGIHYIPPSGRPMPVAIDRAGSTKVISSEQEAGFWRALDSLEIIYGEDLFVRTDIAAFASLPPNAGIRIAARVPFFGGSVLPYSFHYRERDIVGGGVQFADPDLLASTVAVHWAFTRLLGFGDTCGWTAVTWIQYCGAGRGSTVITAEDVAYKEVYYAAQQLRKQFGARGLAESHQGERHFLLLLPAEGIVYSDTLSLSAEPGAPLVDRTRTRDRLRELLPLGNR